MIKLTAKGREKLAWLARIDYVPGPREVYMGSAILILMALYCMSVSNALLAVFAVFAGIVIALLILWVALKKMVAAEVADEITQEDLRVEQFKAEIKK